MTRTPLILLPDLLLDERLYGAQIASLADRVDAQIIDLAGVDSIAGMAEAALARGASAFRASWPVDGRLRRLRDPSAAHRSGCSSWLCSTPRPARDGEEARTRRRDLMARGERGEFESAVDQLLPLFVHPDRLADRDLVTGLRAMAGKVGRDGFLRQQTAILHRIDSRASLAAIGGPTWSSPAIRTF